MCRHDLDRPLYYVRGIDQMIFSASRIDTHIACHRKAGWKYLAGYDEPETESQKLGKAVHAILENVKKTGELIDRTTDAGAIAAEALPYLNALPADTVAEGYFTFRGRHQWQGYKDLSWSNGTGDYKTTGDFRNAKDQVILSYDPQALLYAEHNFSVRESEFSLPAPGAVTDLLWLYLRTKKPYASKPVEFQMSRTHAARGFRALESFADEMQAAADAAPVDVVERHKYILTLAPNEEHCNAYHRPCPHVARCSDLQMFRDPNLPKQETHMSVLERMKQLQAAEDAATSAPAGTFTVHSAGPDAGLQPGVHPVPTTTAWTPQEAPTASHGAPPAPESGVTIQGCPVTTAGGINPPKRPVGRPRKAVADPSAPPAPGTETAGKLAALLAAPPPEPATVVTSVPPPAPAAAPTPITPHTIATLFVGCMPVVKGQATDSTDFDQIWARAKDMIGAAAFFGGYGYKTNGMMLEAVQRIVAQDRPQAVVIMDPRTPEAVLCLSYLRANATVAVESLR